jgi:hypothetical protein
LAQPGRGASEIAAALNEHEHAAGRVPTDADEVRALLEALAREGFLASTGLDAWRIAD